MENLDYVKLACSTDPTRPCLTGIFRDTDKFIATDGHRMHWSNGLPDATPHYLDNRNEVFPDYKLCLPTIPAIGTISFTDRYSGVEILKTLKAIDKLIGPKHRKNQTKILYGTCLELTPDMPIKGVILTFKSFDSSLSLSYSIPQFAYTGEPLKIGINLRYLIDALALIPNSPCQILFISATEAIQIKYFDGSANAIIMPEKMK